MANDHKTVHLWHMWFIELKIKFLIVFAVLLNPFCNNLEHLGTNFYL